MHTWIDGLDNGLLKLYNHLSVSCIDGGYVTVTKVFEFFYDFPCW